MRAHNNDRSLKTVQDQISKTKTLQGCFYWPETGLVTRPKSQISTTLLYIIWATENAGLEKDGTERQAVEA